MFLSNVPYLVNRKHVLLHSMVGLNVKDCSCVNVNCFYNVRFSSLIRIPDFNELATTKINHCFNRCAVLHIMTFKQDRKSTRLNSSHVAISYAVFCLKKQTTK